MTIPSIGPPCDIWGNGVVTVVTDQNMVTKIWRTSVSEVCPCPNPYPYPFWTFRLLVLIRAQVQDSNFCLSESVSGT